MRLLHARTDLLGRSGARRDQGRHTEPCDRRPDRAAAVDGCRAPRAHERKYLPMRCLFQHRRCDHRSGGAESMKSFTYERAGSPAEAAAAAARIPGAKFIAGGTNRLDLMKLEIETPRHLLDVNGLALRKFETRR